VKAINDFKTFILRGNVVDLAIGIVIGAAFTGVVQAFVKDFVNPLIGAFGGQPNFTNLTFTVGKGTFLWGDFLTILLNFLIVALVVFFFVVRPVNRLMSRRKTELAPDPTTRDCPYCLSSIPMAATRCAFCTAPVEPVTVASATRTQ
jgi:large conductance mechanosensitive channel